MRIEKVTVGPLACHCRIFTCEETKKAIVVDPGAEPEKILARLPRDVTVTHLVHTHAHFDHIGATRAMSLHFPEARICLHKNDQLLYDHLIDQGKFYGIPLEAPVPVTHYLQDGEEIIVGSVAMTVMHTPGHSPGSVCFQMGDRVLTGDTLFEDAVGRSDLWGGDEAILHKSLRQRLFVLDDDMCVCPGHGNDTLIGLEKRRLW